MPTTAATFPIRCFVCDDHPLWTDALRDILHASGFAVQGVATTAAAMLAALRVEPAKLLVLDLELPDANGLELLPILRAERLAERIVIMSGRLSDRAIATALSLGADSLIDKVTPVADIVAQLRDIANGVLVMSPAVSRACLDYWQQPRRRLKTRELQAFIVRRLGEDKVVRLIAAELQAPHLQVRDIVDRLFRRSLARARPASGLLVKVGS